MPPHDRPDDIAVDPSQISFAGVLAQLFHSLPSAASAPDPSAAAPTPSVTAASPTRETQPPEKPEPAPRDEAPEKPREDRKEPPADSAETRQTPPSDGTTTAPAQGSSQKAAQPPTEEATSAQAPSPVVTPPTVADLKAASQAEPEDSGDSAAPAPAPQDPATTTVVTKHDPQPTPPPAPQPEAAQLPPLVQHAQGRLDAPAIGAPDAATGIPSGPGDAPKAPSSQDVLPPVDASVRVDAVSVAAQAAPVVVTPAGGGSDAGLDARGGQRGNADLTAIPGGASRAAQGDFAGDLAEASGVRRPDAAQMVDRVVRGMRLSMASGQTRMKFLLSPPRLGSLTVELEMKHGVLSAHLAAETAEAQDLLSRNLAALTDSLRKQGIQVGAFTVGARQDGGGGAQTGGQGGSGAPTFAGGEATAADDARAYADERRRLSLQDQIVDLMA